MSANGNHSTNDHTILVVDDEPAVHRLLNAYLTKYHYVVESCLDSQEVVEKIHALQPDLVLLDLMMPRLDGVSATRRIRNLELESYLPIIILTAKKEIGDLVTALEAGADDYITKPFEFEELMARMKNMLRLKRLQDRLVLKTRELNEANRQIKRLNQELVRTNKQLQQKLSDFHNLLEASYRLMGQLEFDQLLKQAIINTLGIMTTKNVALLLNSKEEQDIFEIVESKGFRRETLQKLKLYRHNKLIHYLEIEKKAFSLRNVSPEFKKIVPFLKQLEIAAVSPLLYQDNIIGLLCLGPNIKEEEYTEESLETLSILSTILAIAIYNAWSYDQVKAMSYTDGMTGLHNYRFFQMRMKEEMARARRYTTPISLLIMDVDNFKNYNDTLGHPAGDEVLRKFSEILRKSVRDNDIVARYGGEEFAILLPGARHEGAFSLAERIRKKVESTEFYREDIQPQGRLTVSVGTATFPEDAMNEEELVDHADQALYHAKSTGRNRVVEAYNIVGNS